MARGRRGGQDRRAGTGGAAGRRRAGTTGAAGTTGSAGTTGAAGTTGGRFDGRRRCRDDGRSGQRWLEWNGQARRARPGAAGRRAPAVRPVRRAPRAERHRRPRRRERRDGFRWRDGFRRRAGSAGGRHRRHGAAGTGGAPPDPGTPIGFATLNGGTTGGKGAQVVTATTYAEPKIVRRELDGLHHPRAGHDCERRERRKISIKSNKSLVGVGSTAFLFGVGLEIDNATTSSSRPAHDDDGRHHATETAGVYRSTDDEGVPAILVNGGDAIAISGTSKNIWIDHCELFNEDPSVQTNQISTTA